MLIKINDLGWPWTAKKRCVLRLPPEKFERSQTISGIMYRSMILVSRNVRYYVHVDGRGGSSGRRRQTTVWLSTTTFFGYLGGFFENFREKAMAAVCSQTTPTRKLCCGRETARWRKIRYVWTYRNLQRHHAVRPAIARLSCIVCMHCITVYSISDLFDTFVQLSEVISVK